MKIVRLILVLGVFFMVTGKSEAQLTGNGGGGNATSLQFGANAPIPNDSTNPASGNFLQVSGGKIVGAAGTGATAPGSTAGAIQYNNGGSSFGGAVLTGIVKANGTSAPTAAVSGTDYAPATTGSSVLLGNAGGFSLLSGNTLAAHNFGSQISAAGVLIGSQPACSDLTGAAASCGTNATELSSGTVPAARLPNPSASTLGGTQSIATSAHNFLTGISTAGVPSKAQPLCGDLSDSAASCSTDTTVATNITSGTLPAARLPNPSASTLGGTQSIATAAHNFLTGISTSGVPSKAQPASTDLSDLPLPVSSGGTHCGGATFTASPIFANLNGSPTLGDVCTITDALTCAPGSMITVGGGATHCQITWLGSNWIAGGSGSASGSTALTGQTCTAASCTISTNLVNANAIANPITATLQAATATNTPVQICKTDATLNAVTVTAAGTDLINGNPTFVINKQYQCINLSDTATGMWALSGTDYPVTQTLAPHNFATQYSANGVLSGTQPNFGDIAGMAAVGQGGTGCGAAGLFATVTAAAAQTSGTTCTITDAVTCNQGAVVTAGGGSTYCQITLMNGSWIAGGASSGGGAGGIGPGVTGNPTYYTSSSAVGAVSNVIHAGAGSLATAFAACPAYPAPCIVIADPNQTYNVSTALIIGANQIQGPVQYLINDGARIHCTDTGGAGHACLVIGDKGHVSGIGQGGPASNFGIIDSASTTSIDALVESYAAYSYSGLGVLSNTQCTANLTPSICCSGNNAGTCPYQQTNFDLENTSVVPNTSMTLNKAVVWESAIDGDGVVANDYIGQGPASAIGILVDDAPSGSGFTGFLWNNLYFGYNELQVGNDAIGMKVVCTSGGGTSLQIVGGSMVDGTANTTQHLLIDGTGAGPNCFGHSLHGLYFEGKAGEAAGVNFLELKNALAVTGTSLVFNGGPGLHDAIKITGGDQIKVDGKVTAGVVTNVIDNITSAYTYLTNNAFDYHYYAAGSGPIVDGPKAAVLAAKPAALSSCGSGALSTGSNAYFGRITMTGAVSCILTPGFTCPNAVEAQLTDDSLAGGASISAQSTTTVTIAASTGNIVDYAAGCR